MELKGNTTTVRGVRLTIGELPAGMASKLGISELLLRQLESGIFLWSKALCDKFYSIYKVRLTPDYDEFSQLSRIVKFRGKSVHSGDWIYGVPVVSKHGEFVGSDCLMYHVYGENMAVMGSPVHKYTVGEFTGTLDDNGTEVFEGDIIAVDPEDLKDGQLCVVEYDSDKCMFVENFGKKYAKQKMKEVPILDDYCFKVVGNVHDNPELIMDLLEKEDKDE